MHECMLVSEPRHGSARPPTSGVRCGTCSPRHCLLPAGWHYASKLFFSQKRLENERERQLRSSHWLVVHPYSPFKLYWSSYIMVVFTASLFYMPMQVFVHCPNPLDIFITFSDVMGVLAIIINFLTGFVDEDGKKIVLEPREIALQYLKDTFVLDVISALPLQYIELYEDCAFPTHTVMYLFKLFRLVPAERGWRSLAYQFGVTYTWSTCFTFFMRTIVFFHWMTFCHYQWPVFFAHSYAHEGQFLQWLKRFKVVGEDAGGAQVHPFDKYMTNLYFVTGLCIGAGFYSVAGENAQLLPEQVMSTALSLVGLIFMTYSFTTLIRLVLYRKYGTYVYYGRLRELQEYLDRKRVPQRLRRKIQLFINYHFNGRFFNEKAILNTLNVQIKQEINMFCCKKLVVNVPLFQDMPIALINTIIFSLVQVLYMPGEIVVRYGQPGSSLYLISSGTVAIMDANGKEVGHLKDGAFFGENALVRPGTPRSATVIALEITEIYKLNHGQFCASLQPCPRLKRRLLEHDDAAAPAHTP